MKLFHRFTNVHVRQWRGIHQWSIHIHYFFSSFLSPGTAFAPSFSCCTGDLKHNDRDTIVKTNSIFHILFLGATDNSAAGIFFFLTQIMGNQIITRPLLENTEKCEQIMHFTNWIHHSSRGQILCKLYMKYAPGLVPHAHCTADPPRSHIAFLLVHKKIIVAIFVYHSVGPLLFHGRSCTVAQSNTQQPTSPHLFP